jgi:hypothetical protein
MFLMTQRFRVIFSVGVLGCCSVLCDLKAQEASVADSQQNSSNAEGAPLNLDDEKAKLLNQLKTQIEPSLLERDLKRLRRDVMRLGSFRSDWVSESEKFLAGNSALAELFLYDFSRVKNARLNEKILETLLDFPSYQFPTAVLAFESELSLNPRGRSLVYELMSRVLSKSPQVWPNFSAWLLSQNDNSADYFQIFLSACRAQARLGGQARSQIEEKLAAAPQDFWSRLVIEDLRACLRGV